MPVSIPPRPRVLSLRLILRQKRETHRRQNANKRGQMVPPDFFAEIQRRETAEHRQRDDFLDDLQLRGGIDRVAPAVGRHLEDVFKKRDAPAHQNDEQQRFAFEFQMAVPRKRHEHVRAGQQHDGQPAGFGKIHAAK